MVNILSGAMYGLSCTYVLSDRSGSRRISKEGGSIYSYYSINSTYLDRQA